MVARRVVRNSTFMIVAQAITWISSLVLIGTLGRALGDDGFGDLYLAIAFGTIAYVLVEFGIGPQLEREIARDHRLAGPHLANAIIIKVALSLLAYGVILLVVHSLHYSESLRLTIAVYCLSLPVMALSSSLTSVYRATEDVFHATVGQVIERVSVCLLAIAMLRLGFGVVAVAASYVAGLAGSALWQVWFLLPRLRGTLLIERRMMRMLLRGGTPFVAQGVAVAVYSRADILILSVLAATAVKGWYGAAYRLFETLSFFSGIVSVILWPILSRLSVGPQAEFRRMISMGFNVMLIAGMPICAGLFVLAEPIILLVYGKPEFVNAVPALRWLAIALFIGYMESVARGVLVSTDRERRMVPAAFLGAILNVGLNWFLIPIFQHVGAAAITAVTDLLILGYWLIIMPRGLLPRATVPVAAKAAASAGMMCAALYALRGHQLLVLIPAGALVYCFGILILQAVTLDDVRAFRGAPSAPRQGLDEIEAPQA